MPVERRQIPDRRKKPTRPLSRYTLRGRRRKARRADEDKDYYVDWYEPRYFVVLVFTLILCLLDAFFTFRILELGGKELNPMMLILIDKDPLFTLFLKYLITALCLIVILVHKNFIVFRRVKAHVFIYVVFSMYLTLVVYEGYFFFTHCQ